MRITSRALPADELESLRGLAGFAGHEPMPGAHRESLIRAGLAAFQSGVLTVTTMGRAKLALEITRASWESSPA